MSCSTGSEVDPLRSFATLLVLLLLIFSQLPLSSRSCLVPSDSVPLTAKGEDLLITEGRCYLACLREGGAYQNFGTRQEVPYPAWPFPIVQGDCTRNHEIHECTRGCRVFLLGSGLSQVPHVLDSINSTLDQCTADCGTECQEECGGASNCTNPDATDLWMTVSGCSSVECSTRIACQTGCVTGEYILGITPFTPPPRPLTHPTLTPLTNLPEEAFRAGVYSVNLTSAMPRRGQETPLLSGFLFKIEDDPSGNLTYLWQQDPRENLDLSSHACRSVSVSFAVVNEQGPSEFSGAVTLVVYGDGCEAETTVAEAVLGRPVFLEWPESNINETVLLEWDPCEDLTALRGVTICRTASRVCEANLTTGASWGPIHQQTFSGIARELCAVASLINESALAVEELENITAKAEDINVLDVGIISTLLSVLLDDAKGNQTLSIGLLKIVDNLLELTLEANQQKRKSLARILEIVEVLVVNYPIPETQASVTVNLTSLSVTSTKIDSETFAGFEFISSSKVMVPEDGQPLLPSVSLSIPPSLFDVVMLPQTPENWNSLPRISNIVYENNGLFVTSTDDPAPIVASVITSVMLSVGSNIVRVSNLPVTLIFAKKYNSTGHNISCNVWLPMDLTDNVAGVGRWSAVGCAVREDSDIRALPRNMTGNVAGVGHWSAVGCAVREDSDIRAVCECTHFANFAILEDTGDDIIITRIIFPDDRRENSTTIPEEAVIALSAFSHIGLHVSTIGLVITIITYLCSKKLRNLEAGQLLVLLCFGLLGIYLMFILGSFFPEEEEICAVIGGLLQYFLLVTFFMMAAEAINLYLKLVIVLGIPGFLSNRYVLKVSLIAWITPLFVVPICQSPNWKNYVSSTFCRPHGVALIGGLGVPFLIIYIFNWIIFILIFISLWRKRRNIDTACADKEDTKTKLKRQFIAALTLSLLFGLGWGVGFGSTSSITSVSLSVTLQVIFVLLTTFQGLFIFIMHCVRRKEARNLWKEWIYIITCHKVFKHLKENTTKTPNYANEQQAKKIDSDTLKRGKDGSRLLTSEAALVASTAVQAMDASLTTKEEARNEQHQEPVQLEDGEEAERLSSLASSVDSSTLAI